MTSIQAEASAFLKLLPRFQQDPALYEQMKLAEAMPGILTNVQETIFLPQRADGKTRELRLMLNREPLQP